MKAKSNLIKGVKIAKKKKSKKRPVQQLKGKPKIPPKKRPPQQPVKAAPVSNVSRICDRTIESIYYVFVFIMPVIFLNNIYDIFGLTKTTAFRFFTYILLFAWLIKIIADGKLTLSKTWLYLPLGIFCISAVFSTIFSIDPLRSLYGEYKRYEGLFTILSYVIFFFITLNLMHDKEKILRCIRISIFSAILVSIYGLIQFFGKDPILQTTLSESPRIFSSMGNPVFLAAYLDIAIVFAFSEFIFGLIKEKEFLGLKNVYYRFFLILPAILLIGTALFLTGSRAGYAGAFFGFLLVIIFVFLRKKELLKWIAIIFATALILGGIFISVVIAASPSKGKILISRLNLFEKEQATSFLSRKYEWIASFKIIERYPVLGAGLDTFDMLSPQYIPEEFKKSEQGAIADKAHNDLLQTATSMGIFGLVIYLWFLIYLLYRSFKYLKKSYSEKDTSPDFFRLFLCLTGALIAYLVQIQFEFSIVQISCFYWLVMGLIIGLGERENTIDLTFTRKGIISKENVPIVAIILVIGAIFPLYWLLKPILGDNYFYKALNSLYSRDINSSVNYINTSISLMPRIDRYLVYQGLIYYQRAQSEQNSQERAKWLAASENSYKKATEINPRNSDNWANLGKFYTNVKLYDKAYAACRKAVQVNPYSAGAHNDYASLYNTDGKVDQAIKEWETTLDIDPSFYEAYSNLIQAYKNSNQKEKAINLIKNKFLSLNYDNDNYREMKKRLEEELKKLERG